MTSTDQIEADLNRLARPAPARMLMAVELGTGLVDGYTRYESPLGEVVVTFNPRGVSSVDLASGDFEDRFRSRYHRHLVAAMPPRAWQPVIGRAVEAGQPGNLPLDLTAVTEFQRQVLRIAGTIPRGQVRPYSWLAQTAGRPGAVRAVGSTMARNPVPLIVPCHRVVRSDGRIGKYSLGGPENKWSLLLVEGADPAHLEELAVNGIRYLGSDTTLIFCHPTCSNARRIAPSHLRHFPSKDSAASSGYRPCRVCRP